MSSTPAILLASYFRSGDMENQKWPAFLASPCGSLSGCPSSLSWNEGEQPWEAAPVSHVMHGNGDTTFI